MHKKHEPCKDTTHLGTEDFLKHLQSLPSYANQVRRLHSACGCAAAHRQPFAKQTDSTCKALMRKTIA